MNTYEIEIQRYPLTFTVKARNPEDAYELAKDLFYMQTNDASIYSHSIEEVKE